MRHEGMRRDGARGEGEGVARTTASDLKTVAEDMLRMGRHWASAAQGWLERAGDEARFAFEAEIAAARRFGRDGGAGAEHGLDQGQGQALEARGQHQQVMPFPDLPHVVDLPSEVNVHESVAGEETPQ